MTTAIYIILGAFVLAAFYLFWRTAVRTYRRYRGKMLVTCPETGRAAGVLVDAGHAAGTAVHGAPDLRLEACTRWPERENCGQECLAQIETSPENCLVRSMLTGWYSGKPCAFCGKAFETVDSYDHRAAFWYDKKPALLAPNGAIVEWSGIPVEKLPEALETHSPVCWNCLIAERFRREHPERVVDRNWK